MNKINQGRKIIELYGLPSSGKTTLAKKLAEKPGLEIIKIREKPELIFYNLLFLIQHPINFFKGLFVVVANSSSWKMFYYKFTNCFLHVNAKFQKALNKKQAIIDQGYFQNIISVFEKPINDAELVRALKLFLFPDILIIFDMSRVEMGRRFEKRDNNSRKKFGEKYFSDWQDIILKNHNLFLKNLSGLLIKYIVVDASKSEDEVYSEVLKIINK